MRRLFLLTVLVLGVPLAISAESYPHGRLRTVEGEVSIQRGSETGTEEAQANMPFLPGDRIWTDGSGRAEFQFGGGSILRVDAGSKLDYVAHDDGREEQITLRLWSGALYLHGRDRDPVFDIETPGGVVSAGGRAIVRLDVQSGELRLSVFEGDATVADGRSVRVRAGERVYARRGEAIEGPRAFDREEGDEFASWDQEQQQQVSYAANRPAYVPDEVAPYYSELESHGSWYYETEVGNVWRPYVAANWQPYFNGRWMWTAYGWTWVPAEAWGWAPSHFGRWGWSGALGWYWIPGRTWGPAWVSWASGGDYFGWCPLGYRDRPVLVWQHGNRNRGQAVVRGGSVSARATETAASPWVYLRRGDVARGDVARRRVQPDPAVLQRVRVVEATQGRLTRELAVSEVPMGAITKAPRNVSTRQGIGDTVPELRSDPMTTIPVARRRGNQDPSAGVVRSQPESAATAAPGTSKWTPPSEGAAGEVRTHPTDVRSGGRRLPPEAADESAGARTRRGRGEPGVEGRSPERPIQDRKPGFEGGPVAVPSDRSGTNEEAQREVLRPVFKPLSRPRGDDGSGADRGDRGGAMPPRHGEVESRPRGAEARPREATPPVRENRPETSAPPRPAAPPPPPASRPEGGHARHRDKDGSQ